MVVWPSSDLSLAPGKTNAKSPNARSTLQRTLDGSDKISIAATRMMHNANLVSIRRSAQRGGSEEQHQVRRNGHDIVVRVLALGQPGHNQCITQVACVASKANVELGRLSNDPPFSHYLPSAQLARTRTVKLLSAQVLATASATSATNSGSLRMLLQAISEPSALG